MFLNRTTRLLVGKCGKCKNTGELEDSDGKTVRCLDCNGTGWLSITVSQLFDFFDKELGRG